MILSESVSELNARDETGSNKSPINYRININLNKYTKINSIFISESGLEDYTRRPSGVLHVFHTAFKQSWGNVS